LRRRKKRKMIKKPKKKKSHLLKKRKMLVWETYLVKIISIKLKFSKCKNNKYYIDD
jgi:hypothetical protein